MTITQCIFATLLSCEVQIAQYHIMDWGTARKDHELISLTSNPTLSEIKLCDLHVKTGHPINHDLSRFYKVCIYYPLGVSH